jgi:hypothetical protein
MNEELEEVVESILFSSEETGYTAVTRGRQLVILIGTRKALAIAIKNADTRERCSGLRARLAHEATGEFRLRS